jgi:hypothetical protein
MANPQSGVILQAAAAATILAAAGVGPDTDVGEGMNFVQSGVTYYILQRGVRFPNPDAESPDGWHIVYAPPQSDLDTLQAPDPWAILKQFLDSLKPFMWAIVAVLFLVLLLQSGALKRD